MPFLHLGFLILFMAGYIGVAYITKATKGFYTYDFLDPNKGGSGRVAAYAFGIAAGTIVLFVVVWAVQKLKVWLFERVAGKREGSYEGVALVEKGGRRESV